MRKITLLFIVITLFFSFTPIGLSAQSQQAPATGTSKQLSETSLLIETDIKGAEVYLNGVYSGKTPLYINPIKPGIWQLSLKKTGYRQESVKLTIQTGNREVVKFNLVRLTGVLKIENLPANTELATGEYRWTGSTMTLPEDTWNLSIRSFGYVERTLSVSIVHDKETIIDGTLERAQFEIFNLKPSKRVFNPTNPGSLGEIQLSFVVTAPGSALLEILNPEGFTIRSISMPDFKTWNQSVTWNGRDDTGTLLPDASYRIRVTAHSGQITESIVRIDRTVRYPSAGGTTGSSSIGSITLPSRLPEAGGIMLIDLLTATDGVAPGLYAGVGITPQIDASVRGTIYIDKDAAGTLSASGTIKYGWEYQRFDTAVFLRYAFAAGVSEEPQPLLRNGLTLGLASEYRFSVFAASILAECTSGDQYGFFSTPKNGAALGGTIRWIDSPVPLGLGIKTELRDFTRPSKITMQYGASLHWTIPGTNLVFHTDGGIETDNAHNRMYACTGFGAQL